MEEKMRKSKKIIAVIFAAYLCHTCHKFESPVDFNDSQLNNLKIDAKYGLRAL